LPIGLPMYDIHTIGAGGGSIAWRDIGGSLRVGPQSAGAIPGPACYGRGGKLATVTDANVVLGRIRPEHFLGGAMRLEVELAREAIERVGREIDRDLMTAALGIVQIAEANMAAAVRAVTSRRGHDPRQFALLSFGGAGGLHACAIAELLEIPWVLVPPYSGALSALGMMVAPATVDVSRTVIHLGQLDDASLREQFDLAEEEAGRQLPGDGEYLRYADVRFRGQSHEISVDVKRPSMAEVQAIFQARYAEIYGRIPQGRAIEIVALRVRKSIAAPAMIFPAITGAPSLMQNITLIDAQGNSRDAYAWTRRDVRDLGNASGPGLVIDPEATTYVPPEWKASARDDGTIILERIMESK